MGSKFASLHIQTNDLKRITDIINHSNTQSSFFVKVNNNWISIYSDSYHWEGIEQEAKAFSNQLSQPVLSVGYFDDDLVEIALIQNNQVITKQISGYGAEDYGLDPENMNIDLFIQTLQLSIENEEFEAALEKDDISEIVEEMGKLLNLELWQKYEWIEEEGEKEKYLQVNS
ncbi:hypothetical protein V1498_12670 [Peribacillus sp. SCS-26]|uniref:hypothetical protein n=1 Tax=Paraperibacillus marinus TaxID=3115295 RepID=UPI0039061115